MSAAHRRPPFRPARIGTRPAKSWCRSTVRLHRLDKRMKVRDRRRAIDAVIEIDDMPSAAPRFKAAEGGRFHFLGRAGPQNLLIDVPLKDEMRILAPGRRQIVADAEADDV